MGSRPTHVFANGSCINLHSVGSDSEKYACNAEDLGSFPGLERSPEAGMQPPPVFLPIESPWTEVPGGLQSMESQKSWTQLSD